MEPPTEMEITSKVTIKEELACDPESNPQMDMNVNVKQELEDDLLGEINYGSVSIPESIVKDELIIDDTLEPIEEARTVPIKKKNSQHGNKKKPKQYPCQICHKKFTTKEYANKHSRSIHDVDQGPVKSTGQKCPLCEYIAPTKKENFAHLAQHQDKESGMWRCILCSKLYEERAQLKRHIKLKACKKAKMKNENKMKLKNLNQSKKSSNFYTCAECNQKFSIRSKYDAHIKYEHEPNGIADRTKQYSCELCGLLLVRKSTHLKHMEIHEKRHGSILTTAKPELMTQDENGLIQCSECTEKFPSRESYIAHYKRHMFLKQLDIRCTVCGKYFLRQYLLTNHLRTHNTDEQDTFRPDAKIRAIVEKNGSFSCSACKSTFTNLPSCNRHIRNQHASNFRCETCGKFWQSEASLRKHEKRHEKTLANKIIIETNENGLFMCYECPSVFTLRCACFSHIQRYHRNKPTSSQDTAEESDSVSAKAKRGFPCKECGKNLSNNYTLTQHMLRHKRQRKGANSDFKCSECGKQLPNEKSLISHTSWHTRKKAKCFFTCLICKMTFSSHQSYLKHSLTMHQGSEVNQEPAMVPQTPEGSDRKQIECTECEKKFTSLQRFRLHFQKMHKTG